MWILILGCLRFGDMQGSANEATESIAGAAAADSDADG